MAWKYLKLVSAGSSSTETNPQEINILAGATQCQIGGTIEATRPPAWSALTALIDGSFTSATYWEAGPNPTITVTMPASHTDLTLIEIPHTYAHYQHTVYLSQDKIEWIQCPFLSWANLDKQQNFSIPALPQTNQNFTANGVLNISVSQNGGQDYTQGDTDKPTKKIRYIRDHLNGSDTNQYSHWVEIQAYLNDINFALGKPVTSDSTISYGTPERVTDGDLNTNVYFETEIDKAYVQVDLGQIYDISEVKVWHYNARTYHETKTEISEDGLEWITIFDSAIEGEYLETPQGHSITFQNHFEQAATLNIGFNEVIENIYTANGYEYNQWSLIFLDHYFYTDQIYTANGYGYEATGQDNFSLTETAAQDYTANGLNFVGVDKQEIILNFAAAQEYTPQGYNFATSMQENINVIYLGAQAFTAEGYDVASMAQENILLVSIAAQVYTPIGYNFEAQASQEIVNFIDAAAQDFRAHFEQAKQEIINLDIEAAQTFTAHFEQASQLNFALNIGAAQDYTAIGYTRETTASETIVLDTETSQIFARHYESIGTGQIIQTIAAIQDFQANFENNAAQTIFIEDVATATAIFSNGLQFQENTQENINLSEAAAQTFTAFGGYEFNQSAVNNFGLSDAAASFYELGETGKYTARVTHYLYLQEAATNVYTRNWLDFEATAAENFINEFWSEAASVHVQVNIYEANAAEDLTFYNNPLQFYGKYFEATAQDNFSLSINAANVRTEKYLTFEMQANEFFFLHYTDSNVHEVIYLQIEQNMYYDFVFWDYADQFYSQEHLEFNPQASEIIDLSIDITGQYTNANWLNSFATENIGLNIEAAAEYVQTTIFNYDVFVTEILPITFSGNANYVRGHISKAIEPIDFEHYASLLITTEPRDYTSNEQLDIKLKIVNWVYFESDIYVQTYKIEITKPNTLWEPTEQDRPMVEANQRPRQGASVDDTIFGGQDEFKIDRRILNLTHIDEPTQISYASEIKKPNTLYTNNNEIERGLMDD